MKRKIKVVKKAINWDTVGKARERRKRRRR